MSVADAPGRHTHVIPTVTAKLNAKLDDWDVFAPNVQFTLHHTGGRDWVLVIHHEHLDGAHAGTDLVHVEHYDDNSTYGGLVEDEKSTWILYFDHDGRPISMWLRRDTTGAVVGEPITISGAQVDTIPGWDINMLRESRGTTGNTDDVALTTDGARTATIRRRSDGWNQFSFNDDDGRQVALFVIDQSCTTEVWDRATAAPEADDGVTVHAVPGWFIEVWNALAERRPINFAGMEIPEWLEAFLQSSLAMGTITQTVQDRQYHEAYSHSRQIAEHYRDALAALLNSSPVAIRPEAATAREALDNPPEWDGRLR